MLSMGKHSGGVWENARSPEEPLCSVSTLVTLQLELLPVNIQNIFR